MPKPRIRVLGSTCKNGHLLTEENTYVVKKTGYLQCKTCQLDRQHNIRFMNAVLRKDFDGDTIRGLFKMPEREGSGKYVEED